MSKAIYYTDKIELEINVIGYNPQGESVVIFAKADGVIVFSGVIDCYEYLGRNITCNILDDNGIERLDMLCWTHPHYDHTKGIDKILEDYTDNETCILLPHMHYNVRDKLSQYPDDIYKKVLDEVYLHHAFKFIQVTAGNRIEALDSIYSGGRHGDFDFSVSALSPDVYVASRTELNDANRALNDYSISLLIRFGIFQFLFCSDIENSGIDSYPESSIDGVIDYIKIPHHGSSTSEKMLNKIFKITSAYPAVAITTVFNRFGLPETNLLDAYNANQVKTIVCGEGENDSFYGITRCTIDITNMSSPKILCNLKERCQVHISKDIQAE